jgi:hypothetical protein
MRFILNLILIFIASILLSGCASNNKNLKSYLNIDKPNITKEQLERFKIFYESKYYSYQHNQENFGSGIIFALNKNGNKSIMIMCEDYTNPSHCNANIEILQTIQKYEKELKDNFKIIAKERILYLQDKKAYLKNIKELSQIVKQNFNIVENNENIFKDRLLFDKTNNCSPDC